MKFNSGKTVKTAPTTERNNMDIPKQATEAADLAEQLHSQIFTPTAEETPVVEEAPPVVEETEPPVVEEDLDELRKFKDRYLHLKGKYDAEVPRLHSELKEFKKTVFERLDQVPEKPVQENERLAKFREEYGEEFIENIKELLKAEVDPLLKQSVKPVAEQLATVKETQEQGRQAEFMKQLDTGVKGDWREVWQAYTELATDQPVTNPKLAEFLLKEDPSGLYTNADLISMYNEKWDAPKLAKVMNLYFGETPVTPPPPKPNPVKESMIAPARTTAHITPAVDEKRIWTRELIKEFEIADRQGKYDAETSQAIWNDLMSAPAENRIR